MMAVRHGYSRIVFLVGSFAIKVPNIFNGDRAFVIGLAGNLHEFEVFQTACHCNGGTADRHLAKIYFRLPFGLALVVRRYRRVLQEPVPYNLMRRLPLTGLDPKADNFALDDEGHLVVLDYGNADAWYIGGKEGF